MKIEMRTFIVQRDPLVKKKQLILLPEPYESKVIDEIFGSRVDAGGLIAKVFGEVKLSDGYGEHYIRLEKVE